MKTVDLLQRCLDELDCDVYSDPVTIELVQGIKNYLKSQHKTIVGDRIISTDHGVTITAIEVSDAVRGSLNTGGVRIP